MPSTATRAASEVTYCGCAMTAGRCWCAPGPGVPHDADALHPGTGRSRRGWWRDRSRARADFMPALRQIDWLIPTAARNALSSVVPELRYGRAVLTADTPGAECRIVAACKKSDIADAQAD